MPPRPRRSLAGSCGGVAAAAYESGRRAARAQLRPLAPAMALPLRSPGALALALLLPALAAAQVPMPGGLVNRPVSDPEVRKAAAFAVEAYNRASNNRFYYKALRILDAKSQVVAGAKYYLTVELVRTQCEKKGGPVLSQAEVDLCAVAPANEQQERTCEFQVLSRPWEDVLELEKMSCRAASA